LEAERVRTQKQAKEQAEKQQKEEEDRKNAEVEARRKQEEEWKVRAAKLQQEETQILDLQSGPFRSYLMANVMPLLTKGLIDVVKLRPSDPIDFLAEYLFRHADDPAPQQ
jgi:adenylate kinase